MRVRVGDGLPPDELARFVGGSSAQVDLRVLSARDGERGGAPSAPEVLRGRWCSGYAPGVFGSRTSEQATYESARFRFVGGTMKYATSYRAVW